MEGVTLDKLIREHNLEDLIEPLLQLSQSSYTIEIVIRLAMAYGINAAERKQWERDNPPSNMFIGLPNGRRF